ncbi:hypothetical protein BGZ68_009289 [Mortierella alpina]|nr:hypothetical protein BGZ68_009289 [Mortierella alpina]
MKFSVVIIGLVSFAAFALALPTENDISPTRRPKATPKPPPPASQSVKAGVSTGVAIKSMDPRANQMCVDNRNAETVDWYLSDTNNIVNKHDGLCLDIKKWITKQSTELIVYQCEDNGKNENQLWALSDL